MIIEIYKDGSLATLEVEGKPTVEYLMSIHNVWNVVSMDTTVVFIRDAAKLPIVKEMIENHTEVRMMRSVLPLGDSKMYAADELESLRRRFEKWSHPARSDRVNYQQETVYDRGETNMNDNFGG